MKKINPLLMGVALTSCVLCTACGAKTNIRVAKDYEPTALTSMTKLANFKNEYYKYSSLNGNTITEQGNILVSYYQMSNTYYAIYNVDQDKLTLDKALKKPTLIDTYSRDYVYVPNDTKGGVVYQYIDNEWSPISELTNIKSYTFKEYEYSNFNTYYEEWNVTYMNDTTKKLYYKNVNGVKTDITFNFEDTKGISPFFFSNSSTPACLVFGPEMEDYMFDTRANDDNTTDYIFVNRKGKVTRYTLDNKYIQSPVVLGRYGMLQWLEIVDSAEDCDIINFDDNVYYKLYSMTIDYKTGKTKKFKTKYIFGEGVASDYDSKTGTATLSVIKIVNKTFSASSVQKAIVGKDGKITPIKTNFDQYSKLNKSRYIGVKDGKNYLIDANKNIVADFSKTTDISVSSDRIKVVYDNTVYILDYDGKTLNSFEMPTGSGSDVSDFANDCIIVIKRIEVPDGKTYLEYSRIDKNNQTTVIGTKDLLVVGDATRETKYGNTTVLNITIKDNYYLVESDSSTVGNRVYSYYTFDGKLLGNYDLPITTVDGSSYDFNNKTFMQTGNGYYLITKN